VSEVLELLKQLLQNEDAYQVIAAIRGPDTKQNHNLKYIFTARIRFYAGLELRFLAVRQTGKLDIETIVDAAEEARKWAERDYSGCLHFLGHVFDALHALMWMHKDDEKAFKELGDLKLLASWMEDYARGWISREELER